MYNHTLQWMDHPWQDYARVYASYANSPQVRAYTHTLARVSVSLAHAQARAHTTAHDATRCQGERKRQKLRETLLSIQRAIESNNVSFRGWFPVEDAMDPPALARTDPAPTDVTPKYAVPPELDEFARYAPHTDTHRPRTHRTHTSHTHGLNSCVRVCAGV